MKYVWETELTPFTDDDDGWPLQHHLKVVWGTDPLAGRFAVPTHGMWKLSVAWVTRLGERKWHCGFADHQHDNKTFRSLKAAKAYALAIITLNQ